VLSPPAAAAWIAGPATWTNRIVTLGLLPPQIRRQYRFDWDARQSAHVQRAGAGAAVNAARHAARSHGMA
jgi:uncharacterized protein (DUF2236 family)